MTEGAAASRATLVERDAELASSAALVDRVLVGHGGCLLVLGEAGIGKSELLRSAWWQATEQGVRVLRCRGTELERMHAFGAVRQALEPTVRASGDRLFRGPAVHAAAVFDVAGALDAEGSAGADRMFAILHGLYWMVLNLVEDHGPLVILADDAHWVDDPSLAFFEFLSVRVQEHPVGVILAARPRELAGRPSLGRIRDAGEVEAVRVSDLSRSGVAELVRHRLGETDEALVDAVADLAQGNPLWTIEALEGVRGADVDNAADLRASIAATIQATIRDRVVRRLEPGTHELEVARAVAVLGAGATPRMVAALSGLADTEIDAALDALARLRVLEPPVPDVPLVFVHPLVLDAVYEDIPPLDRSRRHARAALVLRDRGETVASIALHLRRAGPLGEQWAGRVLIAAGQEAMRLGSPADAADLLGAALQEPMLGEERVHALLAGARAQAATNSDEALALYEAALKESGSDDLRAEVALDYAAALTFGARTPEAHDVLRGAAGALEDADGEAALGIRTALHGVCLFSYQEAAREERRAHLSAALGSGIEERPLVSRHDREAASLTAFELAISGEPASRVRPLIGKAFSGAGLSIGLSAAAPYGYGIWALILTEDYDRAERELQRALGHARRTGSSFERALALLLFASLGLRRGRIRDAETDAVESLDLAERPGWRFGLASTSAYLSEILLQQGRLDEAEHVLEPLSGKLAQPGTFLNDVVLHARARLALVRDDAADALSDALAVGERQDAWGCVNPAIIAWRSTASHALAQLGEKGAGARLARDDVRICERLGAPGARAQALIALGRNLDGEERLATFADAGDSARRAGNDCLYAEATYWHGVSLLRSGQRTAARARLEDAMKAASGVGALRVAELARQELAGAGWRPRNPFAVGPDALTPAERRVAGLAARGHTNREIAQRLFVTVKTVEMHLAHAYRKLDIRSRGQLPRELAAH